MNKTTTQAPAGKPQALPVSKKAPAMNVKQKIGIAARMNALIGKKK